MGELSAYYNEHDPYAAQWLRNLIAAGHIAPGDVDERSILDVQADDLKDYTQCHFFAGIGIWSHALRRAGWPDDRPIWTGSCPCQPFSAAGQQKGFDDARHLWPVWFRLIAQCAPPVVLGEQVASKDGLQWLDLVSTDLEGADYAIGASDLCAAGFQQTHLRQRLYFAGLADSATSGRSRASGCGEPQEQRASECGTVGRMADTVPAGRPKRRSFAGDGPAASSSSTGGLAQPYGGQRDGLATGEGRQPNGQEAGRLEGDGGAPSGSATGGLADTPQQQHDGRGNTGPRRRSQHTDSGALSRLVLPDGAGPQPGEQGAEAAGHRRPVVATDGAGGLEHTDLTSQHERAPGGEQPLRDDDPVQGHAVLHQGQIAARWLDVDWLLCRNPAGEPSWRPVEPGTFPLHHGHSNRMGKLRAYGNALDAETATGFVAAVMDALGDYRDLMELL